jgi:hypothetical protein
MFQRNFRAPKFLSPCHVRKCSVSLNSYSYSCSPPTPPCSSRFKFYTLGFKWLIEVYNVADGMGALLSKTRTHFVKKIASEMYWTV